LNFVKLKEYKTDYVYTRSANTATVIGSSLKTPIKWNTRNSYPLCV